MTVTIQQEHLYDKYIYIEQDKYSVAYKVGMCPVIDEYHVGYPTTELCYPTLQKAKVRYNYLRRKLIKENSYGS